jgi:DnaJ-class molecular chaperone
MTTETKPEVCPVCNGTGTGIDPVFGYRGKCYPCDGTGKDHRKKLGHLTPCWICASWSVFGGKKK